MNEPTKKQYLLVINDAPYGNERPYNALRLALNLVKRKECNVRVFLMADGVNCALANQKTPSGYYNIETMLKSIVRRGQVSSCGTCLETRGIRAAPRIEGMPVGQMATLGEGTRCADRVGVC